MQAVEGAFTTPLSSYETNPLPAELVDAGGELCTSNDIDMTGKVALIARGSCMFELKADNAKAQGAIGRVVYNTEAGGDALVLMDGDGIEDFFGFFVGHSDGLAMKSAIAAGTTTFNLENIFDGWATCACSTLRRAATSRRSSRSQRRGRSRTRRFRAITTMHSVVMGPEGTDWENTAFISWSSDGMISLDASDPTDLDWTGQWIGCYGQDGCDPTLDSNGNGQAAAINFWGVTRPSSTVTCTSSEAIATNRLVILKPVAGGDPGEGLQPGGGNTP